MPRRDKRDSAQHCACGRSNWPTKSRIQLTPPWMLIGVMPPLENVLWQSTAATSPHVIASANTSF